MQAEVEMADYSRGEELFASQDEQVLILYCFCLFEEQLQIIVELEISTLLFLSVWSYQESESASPLSRINQAEKGKHALCDLPARRILGHEIRHAL